MADQTERAVLAAEPALPVGETRLSAGAVLRVLPPRALVRLQIPRRMIPQAGALRVGSTALPTTPGRCVGVDPAVLWLAPDGWLLISDVQDGATLVSGVRRDCGDLGVAAVDVSDSLVVFELAGLQVRDLLMRGTSLDHDDGSLALGRCSRQRFAQLPVILRPYGAERVELIVDRGPALWLRDWFIHMGSVL